jgi:hypothetical protein
MTTSRVIAAGPTAEEKREALRAVLQTACFARSGQLRNFLSFICEMEMVGRSAEISEYLIGVEALGRPPGYSTADDSTVRRHAHALRQKLEEVYLDEAAHVGLRIELPKGTYVPRFVEAPVGVPEPAPAAEPARPEAVAPAAATAVATPPRAAWKPMLLAFVLGALVAAPFALRARPDPDAVDPVIREAWAPFDQPGSKPMICLSAPLHIGVLPYPEEGPLPDEVETLAKDSLRTWYEERYPLAPHQRLATHLTTGPIRLGEVFALAAAVSVLDRLHVPYELVAEKNLEVPVLRGRNLILLANPEYSFSAGKLLERGTWTVAYDVASRRRIVLPARADSAEKRTFVGETGLVYGLLTVLPSDGSPEGTPQKTVVVSCTNAAGCHAATEFFASPRDMRALRARFVEEGIAGFPRAYQVVVKCRVFKTQAISGEYAAHTVLEK